MEKLQDTFQNSTVAAVCHWCGKNSHLKPLKVSLKKSELACSFCYSMMKPEPPNSEDTSRYSIGWKPYMAFIIKG